MTELKTETFSEDVVAPTGEEVAPTEITVPTTTSQTVALSETLVAEQQAEMSAETLSEDLAVVPTKDEAAETVVEVPTTTGQTVALSETLISEQQAVMTTETFAEDVQVSYFEVSK